MVANLYCDPCCILMIVFFFPFIYPHLYWNPVNSMSIPLLSVFPHLPYVMFISHHSHLILRIFTNYCTQFPMFFSLCLLIILRARRTTFGLCLDIGSQTCNTGHLFYATSFLISFVLEMCLLRFPHCVLRLTIT